MSFPKILTLLAVFLILVIGIAALLKKAKNSVLEEEVAILTSPKEISLEYEVVPLAEHKNSSNVAATVVDQGIPPSQPQEVDFIDRFFNKGEPKFPIVQTIVYKSRVPWQKGRPAWLSDYASYYSTSRHFIARSLNGKPDYLKQDISEGDRFNVLSPDAQINFYLLIDTSRSKMWFYYIDLEANQRVLVKTYQVGLGRIDSSQASGLLTPLGKFSLGSKVAIYKPKTVAIHNGEKTEMIRIFGTRWIPFEKEISGCTASASGLGIHGVPWIADDKGNLVENIASLGKYESDGCIRLATKDIEEVFAIIISRPTTVELVKDFYLAQIPGNEVILP